MNGHKLLSVYLGPTCTWRRPRWWPDWIKSTDQFVACDRCGVMTRLIPSTKPGPRGRLVVVFLCPTCEKKR